MGKETPTAPDPYQTAQAQTQSNEQTAQYNQQLNMINSSSPYGTVNYTPSSAPGGFTQTTSLSPQEQSLFDQSTSAQNGALGIANSQLGRVSSALGQSVTPGNIQSSASAQPVQYGFSTGAPVQSSLPTQGQISTGYNPGGQIQTGVSQAAQGDQAVQNAANSAYGTATQYLTPQYQQQSEQMQSQLAAQGLNPNDAAWQNAMTLMNNQQNQGYQGAINAATTAGDAEQQNLYGQSLSSGEFANQAQQQQNTQNAGAAAFQNAGQNQGYTQALGAGNFSNAAQAQTYGENQGQASFYDTAQGQDYSQANQNATLGNTAEQQLFNQQAYGQSMPINEFDSLLSSGQVQSPTGINYSPTSVANTNVSQIDQNSFQDQLADYNASNLMGGLFGLGSAALTKYSDARLKTDIRRVGALESGLPIYAYRYVGSPRVEIGVLAQEAAKTHPQAVSSDPDGFLMVNYGDLS